ncbi:hypothetical protein [Hymenobacter sp. BT491]|uniref:hypothetical protein n=1 Tax=Hymenobacter sp. BT491 TaxID=2766779 RepID=UPI001653A812|nr:hypothetical protein [Hymenobacter sp. BT491]MBC6988767.1 hypothetical protein [Hymenobacter sp. BT491]
MEASAHIVEIDVPADSWQPVIDYYTRTLAKQPRFTESSEAVFTLPEYELHLLKIDRQPTPAEQRTFPSHSKGWVVSDTDNIYVHLPANAPTSDSSDNPIVLPIGGLNAIRAGATSTSRALDSDSDQPEMSVIHNPGF